MKPPSLDDRVVKVLAYLTDQTFGYDHWRAAQFSAPAVDTQPALLVICKDQAERDLFHDVLQKIIKGLA